MTGCIHEQALQVLLADTLEQKCALSKQYAEAWTDEYQPPSGFSAKSLPMPGAPEKPELVHPRKLKRRGLGSEQGRLNLMHAIAHIEFNAINLAWDAVYRFPDQPPEYYTDWISVALDETRHFKMIREYLQTSNMEYGDLPAHNGLWEMAVDTAHDILVRMALVPRVMEARGLDVTPDMITGFRNAGDERGAKILQTIYEEEIRHVAIGSKWFRCFCAERELEPEQTFRDLITRYIRGSLRGPFNEQARLAAGFSADELTRLQQMVKQGLSA